MPDPQPRDLLIAVPTYRRTELLPGLIAEITAQAAALAPPRGTRVIVVDNDPARSAAQIVAATRAAYLAQPVPGIAAVRQAALDAAMTGELVIMIDDDVFPEPGWLRALVETWESQRPTAVLGYVRYIWPSDADPWIVAGGFMRRTPHPTGAHLQTFVTGNVLLDADALRATGVRFDLSLGMSGGEDTRLGQDILRSGGTIVACAESVCRDEIPLERVTRAFVRTRTISHGEIRVRVDLNGLTGARAFAGRVAAFAGGLIRWLTFTMLHLAGRLTGNIRRNAVGQRRAWFAVGRMRAARGRWGAEYAR
ncbi:glycosyltransferase family 2 protein [Microbacterium sp.]|uniref:glycosyltransferase family 2 protein n=1 Tax=Microbacterium sp. TaxID=51671 RepID=UPI003C7939B5